MEIERKFWIDTLPELPEERRSDVYQGYLCTEPVELRIRKRVEAGGEIVYQLCVKSIGKLSRHEVETELSRAQFEELASMLDKPLIHKERRGYRLPGGLTLEVNCVDPDLPTAFWYAEVEFETEAQALAWDPAAAGLADYLHDECTGKPGSSMGEYWLQTRK